MQKIVKSRDAGRYPAFEPAALSANPAHAGADAGTDASPPTAEETLEALKDAAEAQVREAYAEGLRRGEEVGRDQFLASVAHAAEALATAAHALQHARQQFLESLEPEVLQIVRLVTERVVRREMQADPALIGRTVRAALELMLDSERVTLRVNPGDLAALREQQVTLLEEFDAIAHLDIRADEDIEPGGCVADAPAMQVDGALKTQLQRIFDAMLE
jgi:flagellar biosynthesis/type III secretory pathway protein FliH